MPRDLEVEEAVQKVKNILTSTTICNLRTSQGPAQLLDHLYIGSKVDAHKVHLLHALKITHVLNCAGTKDYSTENFDNPYDKDSGITYCQFEACDNDGYPILMHFERAQGFIDNAARGGGRVLVHCEMGVNRSGAICVAYIMVHENMSLLQAVRMVKMERPVLLVNNGFQRMLAEFARDRGLLQADRSRSNTPCFDTPEIKKRALPRSPLCN